MKLDNGFCSVIAMAALAFVFGSCSGKAWNGPACSRFQTCPSGYRCDYSRGLCNVYHGPVDASGDSVGEVASDAVRDTNRDAWPDSGHDANRDSGHDSSHDAVRDTNRDAWPDSGHDANRDSGHDAGGDMVVDVGHDATPDVPPLEDAGMPFDPCVGMLPPPGMATGRFTNATLEAGLALSVRTVFPGGPYVGRRATTAASASDVDHDGDPDLFISSQAGDGGLFLNNGFGHFERSAVARVTNDQVTASAFCDLDNDGDPDLVVAMFPVLGGSIGLLFYWNDGTGRFEMSTEGSGQEYVSAIACGDLNGDGRNDLYLSRAAAVGVREGSNELLGNMGERRFVNIGARTIVADPAFTHASIISDVDNDRDLDIIYGDDGWRSRELAPPLEARTAIYENSGGAATFTLGTFTWPGASPVSPMGMAVSDYDHDGRNDYFITDTFFQHLIRGSDLSNVAGIAGVLTLNGLPGDDPCVGWGAHFLDYDRDGWVDVFVACGPTGSLPDDMAEEAFQIPQLAHLLHNNRDGTFVDVGGDYGVGAWRSHAVIGADLDHDGDEDLIVGMIGLPPLFLRNDICTQGHGVTLRLEATHGVRDAIGARVRVTAGGETQTFEVSPQGSTNATSDLALHVGLGPSLTADVEVTWRGGAVDRFPGLAADRVHELRESP